MIRLNRALAAVAACAVVGVGVWLARPGTPREAHAQAGAPVPEVPVAEVVVRPLADETELHGLLAATHVVDVRPRVSGYLQRVRFRDGALVKPGQPLFEIDARPLIAGRDRLRAELEEARAILAHAELELARSRELVRREAISTHELDARIAAERASRARVAAATAALSGADLDLSFTQVTAPVAGRISRALVTEGNLVAAGAGAAPLATIMAVDPIHVVFDVDEPTYLSLATKLHTDNQEQKPTVRVGVIDEEGLPHEATVDYVDTRAESSTGTVRVRAVMPNPDGRLEPGLFARIKLPKTEARPSVLVDELAIGTEQDKRFVLVVGPDHKTAYRPVQLGPSVDGLRVIRSGLNAGDVIVLKGLVRPGMNIRPQHVPMGGAAPSPAGGAR